MGLKRKSRPKAAISCGDGLLLLLLRRTVLRVSLDLRRVRSGDALLRRRASRQHLQSLVPIPGQRSEIQFGSLEHLHSLPELHRQACIMVSGRAPDAHGSAQVVDLAGVGRNLLAKLPHLLKQCWVSHVCLLWV